MLAATVLLGGCATLVPSPSVERRPADAESRVTVGSGTIAFNVPADWALVNGSTAWSSYHFTTGDPDICHSAGGYCDPTTYVMEPGTMDIALGPALDDSSCDEETRPTWDGRTEPRASELREATYRVTWSVCYPGSDEAILIAADLRVGDLEARDALLAQLRAFIETVVLLR